MKKFFLLLIMSVAVLSCRENIVEYTDDVRSGTIYLSSFPGGADIYFENNKTGKTTPDSLTSILPGSYTLKFRLSGYLDESVVVNVRPGEKRFVIVNFMDTY
ncbi:MAG: PEGA domain-containing protein [Ignavibacteriales bacterium]|nr:PEGA domain-containing protein [Ignavibacteriales bacterium]